MSGFMRKAALVVGAVALVAATAGAAAPLLAPGMAGAAGIAGVSAATLTAIGTYGGLAAGVLTAISTATAPGMSSQGSQTSFTTNPQSGLPYAMGRTRMSGLRIYANTNTRPGYTKFNDLLWFGALLSIGGAIGGIEKFTADNEIVSFDASGNAIGDYHDYQGQKIHLGGQQTSALALSLVGGSAPGWTTSHKLSGITHAMWCLRYNKQGEMYGAGAPEPAWIGNWVKVYDPRLDSTYPGGSGSCRALLESTYVWSDNPGLHALTWALGRWQNGKRTCGIGAPVANIRVAEFVECANVCEANGWKVGGVEWTTDSKWDTLKRILQAGGAIPTQTGAMVGCLVSTPRTAIATIESRHLLDSLSIAATKSRRDRFNSVIPRYVDEASDWSVISGTAITVSDYVTADKGQRTKEIDYPLVQVFSGQVAKQPGQLAAYDIVNSREAGPINFTTGPEWIGLKTGDVILLNVPEEGLVNQPVLITRRAPDPSTGKVAFSAQTETYAKHAYALGQSTTPPAPFSLTAPDLKPPAPAAANWAAAGTVTGEGLPAIVVTGSSEMPSADAVLIDYKLPADATWSRSAILSANEPVQHVIAPLQSETAYQVRVGYRVEQIDGDFTILAAVTTGVGIISEISGTIGQQQDQLEQLEQDTAAAQTNIAAAQAQIAAIQSSVSADLSELTAQIGTIDTSLDTLAAQVGTVTTDLASLQSEVGTVAGNLSSLQNQVGTVGTDLASLQNQVGTVSGNLYSLQSEVGSISTDLGSLETTVAAQGGTISTHSNQISAANAAISANATAISTTNTNLASLTTRVGTAEATISTQQTAITSLQGSTASLSTLVTTASGNLLQNSEISPSSDGWSTYTNQSGVIFALNGMPAAYLVSGINALTIQQTDATATGYAEWNQPGIPLEPNSVNDVSVWCLAHRCLVQVYLQWKLADGSTGTAESPGAYSPGSGGTNLSLWGRYVFKAQAPANAVAATLIFRKFGTTSGSNSFAAFCRPQIRRTTASAAQGLPYTPSGNAASILSVLSVTQTQAGQISTLSTSLATANANISTNATAISTANGNISSLTTRVSSAESAISSNATALTNVTGRTATLETTVSAQGASISALQTATSTASGEIATLKTQVTAGGGNLLVNTDLALDTSGWIFNSGIGGSGGRNLPDASWYPATENVLTIVQANSTASGQSDWTQNIALQGDKWYDVSVGAASHRANIQVYLQCIDASGNVLATGTTGLIAPAGGGNTLASFPVCKFKIQAPAATVRGVFYLRKFGTLSDANSYAWFLRPQVAETTATKASPVAYSVGSARATIVTQATAITTLNTQYASLSTTVSTQGASISTLQSTTTTQGGSISTLQTQMSTANANISTNATAISTANGNISSLTTRVSSAESAISTNATALTNVTGRTATLETTVSAQGASISTLQNTTSTQGGQIASLQSTVATQGASISSQGTAISTLQTNVATLTTTVTASSNPNVLPNGGFENQLQGWTGNGSTGAPTSGWFQAINASWGVYAANNTAWTGSSTLLFSTLNSDLISGVDAGATFTLTADADIRANSAGAEAWVQIVWITDNGIVYSDGPHRSVGTGFGFDPAGASRAAFKATYTAPSNTTAMRASLVVYAPTGVTVTSICWRQVKLERGSLATPYSGEATARQVYSAYSTLNGSVASLSSTVSTQGASISTLQSTTTTQGGSISTLQTQMSTANANISANATAISTANGNISSLTTRVSSAESAISSNATALTNVTGRTATLETTVSAQGASISALQTATSTASGEIATLKTQVTAGGGNLLVNTDLALDTSGWIFNSGTGGSGGRNLPDASWYPATENVLTIVQANSTASGQSDWTQNIALQGDKWYDVSVGAASHRANIQVYLQCIDASGNVLATGTTGLIAPAGGGNTLASFPVCKFKIQAPAATVRGVFYLRKFGTLSDANSYAWFLRPQVAETTATKASPVAYSVGSARATIVTQATAITTLNTQYASLSTTVSTQGSSISSQATAITNLQGRAATLESTVSAQGASISTLQSTTSTTAGDVATLTTRVNASAPNILKEGSLANGLTGWATSGGAWVVTSGEDPVWGRYASVTGSVNSYASTASRTAQTGQSYTISADIDRGGNSGGLVAARIVWTNNGAYQSIGPAATKTSGSFSDSEANRVWATGVCPSGANGFYVQLVVESAPSGSNAFRRIKVNVGATPARYSEEATIVQSFETLSTLSTQYASLSSTVATQGVSISTQATAITTIQGNVTTLFGRLYFGVDVGGRLSSMTVNNNGIASSIIFNSDLVRFESPDPGTGALEWKDEAIQMRDGAGKLRIFMGYRA